MPIRKTGSLPEPIDRQVNEIIRGIHEVEGRINEIKNDLRVFTKNDTLMRHVRNFQNPHQVTAKQTGALPLDLILDSSSIYFLFQNSLKSTRGIEPEGLDGATTTDYGLVTGDDLCATLLPAGGVSVAEGTTNLAHGQIVYDTTPPEPIPGYPGALTKHTTDTSDATIILDPQVQAYSVQAWVYIHEDWDYDIWQFRFYLDDDIVDTTIRADMSIKEQWQMVKGTFIGSADRLVLRSSSVGTNQERWTAMVQVEAKPFNTPYTETTRPAGTLAYPDLAEQFNQREFTFAAWWKPYEELGIGSSILDRFFQIDDGTGTAGNRIRLSRIYNSPGLRFEVPNADGSGDQQYSFYANSYPANAWHFVAVVLDVPNMKCRIHLNGEYQEFTLFEVSTMFDIQRFFFGCIGAEGQLNGELKNVLLRPYAVSPETIALWHSLDVPFIDPYITL